MPTYTTNSHCPYTGCKFNCQSKYHHRGKYAYINKAWKQKIVKYEETLKAKQTKKIDWETLKKIGIIYNFSM